MNVLKQRIDVERLVTWALRDQGLGWSGAGGIDGPLAGLAELGTRIDASTIGAPTPALMTDDDAIVVLRHVQALPAAEAALVIQWGRIGERPDWCPEGVGEWRQAVNKRGQPRWRWEKPGDRRSKRWPIMEFIGYSPEHVWFWRDAYSRWREALVSLVGPLNRELANHIACPPEAPEEPWIGRPAVVHSADGTAEPVHRARTGAVRPEHRRLFVIED